MISEEVEEVLRAMQDTDIINALRGDVVVSKMLKAFKKSKTSNIDVEGLFEEIEEMMATIEFSGNSLNLDGSQGLRESKDLRMKIISVRDRLMAIGNKLALYESLATRVFGKTTSYILTGDLGDSLRSQKLSVRQSEAVVHAALDEVTSVLEDVAFLKGRVSAATTECNEKTRTLDSWINLHKQYMFFSHRGPNDEDQDTSPLRKNKKRRSL